MSLAMPGQNTIPLTRRNILSRPRRALWSLLLGGGGQGDLNLPLPVPFNPSSRPVFFGSRPFAFFRLRNIAQCCVIFPFFSRFPPPWESRFPPPLLPPPFLPVSRPPVPPPPTLLVDVLNSEGITTASSFTRISFVTLRESRTSK